MEELMKLAIGLLVLIFGVFAGNYLAGVTKEESKGGQKWFRLIIMISLVVGFLGLVFGNDFMLFSGFFVAIVTSRSLRTEKKDN